MFKKTIFILFTIFILLYSNLAFADIPTGYQQMSKEEMVLHDFQIVEMCEGYFLIEIDGTIYIVIYD